MNEFKQDTCNFVLLGRAIYALDKYKKIAVILVSQFAIQVCDSRSKNCGLVRDCQF